MNLFLKLSSQIIGNWFHSFSQRICQRVRNLLLTTYVNNILGSITALSLITMTFITILSFTNYTYSIEIRNSALITSISLFFSSIFIMLFLTRAKKVEQLMGLDEVTKASNQTSAISGPIFDELLPLLRNYLEKEISKGHENQKIDKLQEALVTTTEVIRDLEIKVNSMEENNNENIHIQ